MNFDELTEPTQPPLSSTNAAEGSRQDLSGQSDQEDLRAESVTSDSVWVSPFTVLPPQPALRKNRNLLRSPEQRLHQRNSSSAYYAAAWGSPYPTPSPSRSPQPYSEEPDPHFDITSPLSSKHARFQSIAALPKSSRGFNQIEDNDGVTPRPRASSWDRSKISSEKFNWLSESEASGSETEDKSGKTPTRKAYTNGIRGQSSVPTRKTSTRSHQTKDSTATITPDTFYGPVDTQASGTLLTNPAIMEQAMSETVEAGDGNVGNSPVDKPLPSLPPRDVTSGDIATGKSPSPELSHRPRMQSVASFQRPKKKVAWKGKSCIIALPLTDRETANLPPLLTAQDVKDRMQKWIDQGYDIDGFTLGEQNGHRKAESGQSRALYPDPAEMYAERKNGHLHVHIPDQGEWDAWVEYLKEEKLRALGVTPSNSEAPQSSQSPFSSSLSRVSSAFPSVAPSPPISALSNNGNQIRIAGNTFSPTLSHPSQPVSHVASPLGGMQGQLHGYKGSIALPRMTSPFDYPVSQPNSFGSGMRQTPNGFGMRQFSPPNMPGVQSLGQILSPIIPSVPTVPSNDNSRGIQNASMEQIRQQQQRQQQIHSQMLQNQHQRQQSLLPQPSKSADLPRTPTVLESPTRSTPEIMHPTPRSHRHNLSAALQKGVDDAEAARGNRTSTVLSEKLQNVQNGDSKTTAVEEENEDPEHEELPVLKRPETLGNVEDNSEIETNPSIAASPLLMNDENPFSNMPTMKDALKDRTPSHTATSSLSRFNVDAPEFSPSKAPSAAGFSFNPVTAQAFVPSHSNNPSISRLTHAPKVPSLTRFNVDAPSFTPSSIKFVAPSDSAAPTPAKEPVSEKKTPAEKPVFTFSSPSFNVEAPEFKPGQSFSFNAPEFIPGQSFTFNAAKDELQAQPRHTVSGSIFSSITIDPNAKANRRGTKVLPILPPRSREATPQSSNEVDEEGRVSAPSDRNKRARRVDDDGDQSPQFAPSAPFSHTAGLSIQDESLNNAATVEITEPSMDKAGAAEQPAVDDAHTLPTVPESPNHTTVPTEQEPPVVLSERAKDPVAVGNLKDEIIDWSAPDTGDNEPEEIVEVTEDIVEVVEDPSSQSDQLEEPAEEYQQKQPALSALAQPFQPIPAVVSPPKKGLGASRFAGSPPPAKPSVGLKASKFAASPEPTPALIDRQDNESLQKDSSPPTELYEYVKPEDIKLSHTDALHADAREKATPKLPNMKFGNTPELMKSIEDSMRPEHRNLGSTSDSERSRIDGTMPSYEEIDAVMKHLHDYPDLGVERENTPVKSTPLVDMRLPPNMRSDAPSPSPRRLQEGFRELSPQRRADYGLGIRKLNDSNSAISDWGDDYSPQQEHKINARAGFFDGQANHIVDNIIEHRLSPLERSIQGIQHSIAVLAGHPNQSGRRSLSTDNKDSDADDEDELEDGERFSQSFRSRSPGKRDRKADRIRNAVIDAMAAYQPPVEHSPLDMIEIRAALEEMRQLSQKTQQAQPQVDFKAMIEEAIASHPRLKAGPAIDDVEAQQETIKLKMDVLEASLKAAEERADQETQLRKQAEEDMQALNKKLLHAQDIANQHREAHETAQHNHAALVEEQETSRIRDAKLSDAEDKLSKLNEKNVKLELLADEYRRSVEALHDEISEEKSRYQDLEFTLHVIKAKHDERDESRQALRNQIERLQVRISQVVDDMSQEETEWRKKEHELIVANQKMQTALDHEIRHRHKSETERDVLEKDIRESERYKNMHENGQLEIARLQAEIGQLRQENKIHQDTSFRLERELEHANSVTDGEVAKATARLQSEADAAKWTIDSLKSDSEAQIRRLQSRLDNAELDLEEQKAKHDGIVNDLTESHNQAIHEANEKRENSLQEQHANHEKKLNDLRERHTRALHNSSDDRHRLEHQLNEKLTLREEKIVHLESKVSDLEDRLEVTKSAARAAVEAATAKGINLPTPASSVVASPPQRATSASAPLPKNADGPEKISPQALRESIMVLQDQLQNREQRIEDLQQELAAVDKSAPSKIKERDTEITMLRELLAVRSDDLAELVSTLSKQDFSRERAKDAAIRLRANMQMEQQLKERAHAIGQLSMPSISTITNLASSPKALPMAAAAAWGNWRKARDFSTSALNSITGSGADRTPSKSRSGSPSNALAGIMTPPSTSQRSPSSGDDRPASPPTMRPLAAAAANRKISAPVGPARPLRGYSVQPRTLSSRRADKRRESTESISTESNRLVADLDSPQTPTFGRGLGSISGSLEFADEFDEDASPFEGIQQTQFSDESERIDPTNPAVKPNAISA